jgi:tetratricopeptide (TPR) repeat protein
MKHTFIHKIKFIPLLILLFCISCSKQKRNIKLAENYYKLALCELSDRIDNHFSYKKSLDYINKALQEQKKAEYLALKGTILCEMKFYKESLITLKESLLICQNPYLKTEILNNYACTLASQGNNKKALSLLQKLTKNQFYLTPEVAHINTGKIYLKNRNYKKAQEYFMDAIKLEPDFIDAYYYAGIAAYNLGDKGQARNFCKTLLFITPEHQGAKNLLKNISS